MKLLFVLLCFAMTWNSPAAWSGDLKSDFKKLGQGLKEAGKEIGKKGKEVGHTVAEGSKKVGHDVSESSKDIRADAKKAGKDTGHWFTDFGHHVRDSWNEFWNGKKKD